MFKFQKRPKAQWMGKCQGAVARLLHPPGWTVLPLAALSAALLIWVFSQELNDTLPAYAAYLLSAYALTVVVARVPQTIRACRQWLRENPQAQAVYAHPLVQRFFSDMEFRGEVAIFRGLVVNLLYAGYRGVLAVLYSSLWSCGIAVYYGVLGSIRFLLGREILRLRKVTDEKSRAIQEYRSCRRCGLLILALNVAMTGVVVMIVQENLYYEYPGHAIFLSALHAFYAVISAVINLVKYRRLNSPLLSASKALALVGALMSMFALQTGLIARFGGGDEAFRLLANSLTGGAVCLVAVATAGAMLIYAHRQLLCQNAEG